jgi:hypothetical protein
MSDDLGWELVTCVGDRLHSAALLRHRDLVSRSRDNAPATMLEVAACRDT